MEIYNKDRKNEFSAFQNKVTASCGDRKTVHCSLPIATMSEDLLERILERSGADRDTADLIREFRKTSRQSAERMLGQNKAVLVYPSLDKKQFEEKPLSLSFSELFIERDIKYTYDEYREHAAETEEFAKTHPSLTLEPDGCPAFYNISYTVIGDSLVIVSKNKYPAIHFVIHHKKMVRAFRNFILPINEKRDQT